MKQPTPEQFKPLDIVSFNAIAGAFARLQMLGDKQIDAGPGDNTAAEKEKLVEYLAMEMMAHIAEFLGAWQICNTEYLPLLRTVRAVATRAGYGPKVTTPTSTSRPENN